MSNLTMERLHNFQNRFNLVKKEKNCFSLWTEKGSRPFLRLPKTKKSEEAFQKGDWNFFENQIS